MEKSLYQEVLNRARADLADAMRKRNDLLARLETVEKDIAQLKRLIGGVHAYVDESEQSNDLAQTGEGLKEAVCTALRAANEDATISDILSILKELQFPIDSHQNPLGSIYTTVTRLVSDGQVVSGEPRDDKKTYRWALRFPQSAETRQLVSELVLHQGLRKTSKRRS
jgi:hypothetical protein